MNKKFLGSMVAAAMVSTLAVGDDTLMQRFDKMEKEMATLKAQLNTLKAEKEAAAQKAALVPAPTGEKTVVTSNEDVSKELDDIKDQISDLNKKTFGNHLKFGVDFRTSYDNIQYEMANGDKYDNDSLFSNRLWLNMDYAATENLSFTGQLAYNKIFGERTYNTNNTTAMEGFDWVSNESAYNDELRVRTAYFFYKDDEFLGADIPWTVSIGRRPSTEGHLINFRDDVGASSPLAHTVNVEFDGASAKFGTEELIGLDGSYIKFCAGRGMSEAEPRFSSTPYAGSESKLDSIDMIGVILVPYDDKQYSSGFQYTYANNLIDLANPMDPNQGFDTVGGLHTATGFVMVNGIGDGINDFLDDTMFFVSGAMSITDPETGTGEQGMLGSMDSETGYSYWIGTQFPSLISDEGRWGAEFNHGSNYWRPITYGEDTMIGSKIAARGDAYELYFTEPLVDDILTFQLRYTYIDYDYAGSNGFFGSTSGTPMNVASSMMTPMGDMAGSVVDTAQDIRAYIRYKF